MNRHLIFPLPWWLRFQSVSLLLGLPGTNLLEGCITDVFFAKVCYSIGEIRPSLDGGWFVVWVWELTDEGEQGQRPEAQKAKSECAAAQMYSDSGSHVPHQGLLSIKFSAVYTPIIPLKFRMEFAKVSRK